MEYTRLILTCALGFVAVNGDISATGPYTVDFEVLEPCDEIGSVNIDFNVQLIQEDDGDTAYSGEITFPFDMDDEKLMTFLKGYVWGSTGGWNSVYNLTFYDVMTKGKKDFPNVFKVLFNSMGVYDKPMPAGTYKVKGFRVEGIKLANMGALPYGRYKFMILQIKDDVMVGCIQVKVNVKEDASIPAVPGGVGKSRFG